MSLGLISNDFLNLMDELFGSLEDIKFVFGLAAFFCVIYVFAGYKIYKEMMKLMAGLTGFGVGLIGGFILFGLMAGDLAVGAIGGFIAAILLSVVFYKLAELFHKLIIFANSILAMVLICMILIEDNGATIGLVLGIGLGFLILWMEKLFLILLTSYLAAFLYTISITLYLASIHGARVVAGYGQSSLFYAFLMGTLGVFVQYQITGKDMKNKEAKPKTVYQFPESSQLATSIPIVLGIEVFVFFLPLMSSTVQGMGSANFSMFDSVKSYYQVLTSNEPYFAEYVEILLEDTINMGLMIFSIALPIMSLVIIILRLQKKSINIWLPMARRLAFIIGAFTFMYIYPAIAPNMTEGALNGFLLLLIVQTGIACAVPFLIDRELKSGAPVGVSEVPLNSADSSSYMQQPMNEVRKPKPESQPVSIMSESQPIIHQVNSQQPMPFQPVTPEPVQRKPFLQGVSGQYAGLEIPIDEQGVILGRNPKEAHLIFENDHFSSRHCVVSYVNGQFLITDYSTNGTFKMNHEKLYKGVTQSLVEGDGFYLIDMNESFRLVLK